MIISYLLALLLHIVSSSAGGATQRCYHVQPADIEFNKISRGRRHADLAN
jgi:hypothetical protein